MMQICLIESAQTAPVVHADSACLKPQSQHLAFAASQALYTVLADSEQCNYMLFHPRTLDKAHWKEFNLALKLSGRPETHLDMAACLAKLWSRVQLLLSLLHFHRIFTCQLE